MQVRTANVTHLQFDKKNHFEYCFKPTVKTINDILEKKMLEELKEPIDTLKNDISGVWGRL